MKFLKWETSWDARRIKFEPARPEAATVRSEGEAGTGTVLIVPEGTGATHHLCWADRDPCDSQ